MFGAVLETTTLVLVPPEATLCLLALLLLQRLAEFPAVAGALAMVALLVMLVQQAL
jgi:hypothetical protein